MSKDLSKFIGSSYLFGLVLPNINLLTSIFLALSLGFVTMYCLPDCKNEK